MLVGNKCDRRQEKVSSVPTSYGQKLAMVRTNKHLTYFIPKSRLYPCLRPPFMTNRLKMILINDFFSSNRHTTLCSVKLVPKTAATSWRLCCTWPGETQLLQSDKLSSGEAEVVFYLKAAFHSVSACPGLRHRVCRLTGVNYWDILTNLNKITTILNVSWAYGLLAVPNRWWYHVRGKIRVDFCILQVQVWKANNSVCQAPECDLCCPLSG